MIHLVTAKNRHLYEAQIAEMHRQRKDLFIDQLGWTAPEVRGDGEFDDFDDARAEYLLYLGPEGDLRASMRMRPTDDRCMIADKFPHLLGPDAPNLKQPSIWEGSRILAAPGFRDGAGRRERAEIRIAAIELGLRRGFTALIGMCDVDLLPTWRNNGWRSRMLGPPGPYTEGMAFAFISEVSRPALIAIREKYAITSPVLIELPPLAAPVKPSVVELADFLHCAERLSLQATQQLLESMRDATSAEAA